MTRAWMVVYLVGIAAAVDLIKEWRDALELLYFGSRRAFKAIALDVLWVELETSKPLFTCLPGDLWTIAGDRKLVRATCPLSLSGTHRAKRLR